MNEKRRLSQGNKIIWPLDDIYLYDSRPGSMKHFHSQAGPWLPSFLVPPDSVAAGDGSPETQMIARSQTSKVYTTHRDCRYALAPISSRMAQALPFIHFARIGFFSRSRPVLRGCHVKAGRFATFKNSRSGTLATIVMTGRFEEKPHPAYF